MEYCISKELMILQDFVNFLNFTKEEVSFEIDESIS